MYKDIVEREEYKKYNYEIYQYFSSEFNSMMYGVSIYKGKRKVKDRRLILSVQYARSWAKGLINTMKVR